MAVGSFSAGLSGLAANAEALSVIGNNLANLNTVGFKASSVVFEDLVYQNVSGSTQNPTQIGLGVGVAQISPVFSQGTIESSRVATNVAIQGNGFFMLDGPQGASYTRAGNFSFDKNGDLVSPDGQKVLGFTGIDPVTRTIIATGEPTSVNIPPGLLRPGGFHSSGPVRPPISNGRAPAFPHRRGSGGRRLWAGPPANG